MHTPDIMIHFDETPNAEQREHMEGRMREIEGVIAPRFNTPNLLVVLYDVDRVSSSELLDIARNEGYQAHIVSM